jgi:hypothetical protein
MAYISFQNWLLREFKDVFGFDNKIAFQDAREDTNPTKTLNFDILSERLMQHKVGEQNPHMKFINEIHWGDGPGSFRFLLGPKLDAMIQRKVEDFNGTPRWITKKIWKINQKGTGGQEETIIHELLEYLAKLDSKPLDSPKRDYRELESLVYNMASSIRRTARPIFIFEGIRKVNDNEYIIRLNVRGQGLQAPNQQRVEENQTHVVYNPNTGMIRLFNFKLASDIKKGHNWQLMPPDFDCHFCPTQPRDEIVETISNVMHWY